ncbi:MAG: agmatine deiminase family protein [Deltaproteobacteria bacterium]|nr:agmatine deiminase family protein [Deltaproteobacteria bacterium]
MPAEWERHEGTWLTWPKDPVTWPDRVPQVEKVYLEMIHHLTTHEKVFLLVDDKATAQKIPKLKNLVVHIIPTIDSWIRDYGPNFLVHEKNGGKELAFNHWEYNAWGGKYEELIADTKIPQKIAPLLNCPVFEPGIVLEGGSIEVNGVGTCLTTKQCLLNKNRNPHLSKKEIEECLKNYLKVRQIIWLEEGIKGDDTDGHIDDIARFVNASNVVCAVEEDPADENYKLLQENFKILQKSRDQSGERLTVIPLPMPTPIGEEDGKPLPASYANFYIANDLVLVPVFQSKKDSNALTIFEKFFPNRNVVGIPCQDLVWGLGTIHCVTQQQPACK